MGGMMEILHKAKRKDTGEWIEGYYTKMTGELSGKERHYISIGKAPYLIEVDPETVCVYTGLKDENGKKIWENDILYQRTTKEFRKHSQFQWEKYGVVKFGEIERKCGINIYNSLGFYIEHLKSVSIIPKDYSIGKIQKDINQKDMINKCHPFKVVGNVFDNPELLEVKP